MTTQVKMHSRRSVGSLATAEHLKASLAAAQKEQEEADAALTAASKEAEDVRAARAQLDRAAEAAAAGADAAAKEMADVVAAEAELERAAEAGDEAAVQRLKLKLQKERAEAEAAQAAARATEEKIRHAQAALDRETAEAKAAAAYAVRESQEAVAALERAQYIQRIAVNMREAEHAEQEHYVDSEGKPLVQHLYWTFACVLAPVEIGDIPLQVEKRELPFAEFVVHMCARFFDAGFEMQLVQRSPTSKHKVVLLLRLPEEQFLPEFRRLSVSRWKNTGEGLTFVKNKDTGKVEEKLMPTEADRIQVAADILNRSVSRGGCGLRNIEHFQDEIHDPRVCIVCPLHNSEWATDMTERWGAKYGCRAMVLRTLSRSARCSQWLGCTNHRSKREAAAADEQRSTHLRFMKEFGVDESFLTEIRNQYGVRFAFLFAFMQLCERFVVDLAVPLVIIIQILSAFEWQVYLQGLSLIGFVVPSVWAPKLLGCWDRLSSQLCEEWGTVGVRDAHVTHSGGGVPNPYYREGKSKTCATIFLVLLIFCMILFVVCLSVFILEWETLIQSTPMCGSWFHETIWRKFITNRGDDLVDRKHWYSAIFTSFIPTCFPGMDENPWPVAGHPPFRGLLGFGLGLIEGILIGVVYSEVFRMVARELAALRNTPDWRVYEVSRPTDAIYSPAPLPLLPSLPLCLCYCCYCCCFGILCPRSSSQDY